MEGFLRFRMQPWLRRSITRCLAITLAAAVTIYFAGDTGTYRLILFSQVILNLQLPFAVIPLVQFTSDRKRMGDFANGLWIRVGAWSCAAFHCAQYLAGLGSVSRMDISEREISPLVIVALIVAGIGFVTLLVWSVLALV